MRQPSISGMKSGIPPFSLPPYVLVIQYFCNLLTWRRKWQPIPVLMPGKFRGWRSLVGYSPWGPKESDTTEQLHFHFHLPKILVTNYNSKGFLPKPPSHMGH